MANNRLFLLCQVCNVTYYLAKFYPATGWYGVYADEVFDKWLKEHTHDLSFSGGNYFKLEYEIVD